MIDIILDNATNDKKAKIKLPIVPRIGDWICWDKCNISDENFAEESLLTVRHLTITSDAIEVWVDEETTSWENHQAELKTLGILRN